MILEGFEIENWSCIKRIAVDSLPPTGVVVLHGPNATGKSSIVAALRACLMDYPATSASQGLKRWFTKNGDDKPRVSVTFRRKALPGGSPSSSAAGRASWKAAPRPEHGNWSNRRLPTLMSARGSLSAARIRTLACNSCSG